MDTTPCLGLKTVIPGQAQKETSINEGLHLLDAIVAGAVEEPARTDPPATPVVGTSYLVASNAVGEWVGHDGALAAFTLGGWRFVAHRRPRRLREGYRDHASISQRGAGAGPWIATGGHSGCDWRNDNGCGIARGDLGNPKRVTGARAYRRLGCRSGRSLFAGGLDFADPARGDPQGDEGEGRDDEQREDAGRQVAC